MSGMIDLPDCPSRFPGEWKGDKRESFYPCDFKEGHAGLHRWGGSPDDHPASKDRFYWNEWGDGTCHRVPVAQAEAKAFTRVKLVRDDDFTGEFQTAPIDEYSQFKVIPQTIQVLCGPDLIDFMRKVFPHDDGVPYSPGEFYAGFQLFVDGKR